MTSEERNHPMDREEARANLQRSVATAVTNLRAMGIAGDLALGNIERAEQNAAKLDVEQLQRLSLVAHVMVSITDELIAERSRG
jgi:hypothetical protein